MIHQLHVASNCGASVEPGCSIDPRGCLPSFTSGSSRYRKKLSSLFCPVAQSIADYSPFSSLTSEKLLVVVVVQFLQESLSDSFLVRERTLFFSFLMSNRVGFFPPSLLKNFSLCKLSQCIQSVFTEKISSLGPIGKQCRGEVATQLWANPKARPSSHPTYLACLPLGLSSLGLGRKASGFKSFDLGMVYMELFSACS